MGLVILYHRIMNKKSAYKWALYAISAVVCGYSIVIIFALIFACNTIQRSWNSPITGGSCIDRSCLFIATAVTNIITDLALIVVPMPLVCGLYNYATNAESWSARDTYYRLRVSTKPLTYFHLDFVEMILISIIEP
jgi:hypothetical protein